MQPDAPLFRINKPSWEVLALGEAAARGGGNVQTGPFGSQLHASDYVDVGVPSVMPLNIGDNRIVSSGIARISEANAERLSRYRLRTGDIVYSRRGDVERRALVRAENDGWLCGTGCLRVRFGEGHVLPEYAAHYLAHSAVKAWIVKHAVGATMPNLNTGILAALPFVLPPIGEQRAIAGALGSLDDKIELNRRMNTTLEGMAQAIFRDWFVDFGPARRKQAGVNDPVEIMGRLLPDPIRAQALADLFPANLGDNGLPEGWQERPIGELAEIVGGSTPNTKSPEFWDSGAHAWATPKDLSKLDGLFLFETDRQITDAGLKRIGSGLSPKGTVLLSSRAPIGYLAIAETPVAVNQGFIALRPTDDMPTAYALFWCRQNIDTIKANANGSTFQEISKKNFRPLTAKMPKANLLQAFTGVVDPLLAKIRQNLTTNQKLVETRDFLLPKLMSGEIRVSSKAIAA